MPSKFEDEDAKGPGKHVNCVGCPGRIPVCGVQRGAIPGTGALLVSEWNEKGVMTHETILEIGHKDTGERDRTTKKIDRLGVSRVPVDLSIKVLL